MGKRGKEIKIDVSTNYNVSCGTVDNKNTKALYINISAWGKPTEDGDINYSRIISRLSKCVKQSTYNYLSTNLIDDFYPSNTIVDLDMRESGVRFGKRSFMNCEITMFRKNNADLSISDETLQTTLKGIINETLNSLDDFKYFSFTKKKDS